MSYFVGKCPQAILNFHETEITPSGTVKRPLSPPPSYTNARRCSQPHVPHTPPGCVPCGEGAQCRNCTQRHSEYFPVQSDARPGPPSRAGGPLGWAPLHPSKPAPGKSSSANSSKTEIHVLPSLTLDVEVICFPISADTGPS